MGDAFLFTWNPAKWKWEQEYPGDIEECAERSRAGSPVSFPWSCAKSTKPQRGDRAFLIKLGHQGRGVFASGWITKGSHPRQDGDFGPRGVVVEWNVFLDPRTASSLLDVSGIGGQHWTPENSGIEIKSEARQALEELWTAHLAAVGQNPAPRDVSDADAAEVHELEAVEGEVRERVVRHRRRERALREQKIAMVRREHGKVACEACGFDFAVTYGIEYAEVHHLKPLAFSEMPSLTKLGDLAVLCANCHRVAHNTPSKVLSVAQIKARLGAGAASARS